MGRALNDLFKNSMDGDIQLKLLRLRMNEINARFSDSKNFQKILNVLLFYMIPFGEILDDKFCIAFLRIFLFLFEYDEEEFR